MASAQLQLFGPLTFLNNETCGGCFSVGFGHQEGMHALQGRARGVDVRLCHYDGGKTSANESFVN